MRASAAPCGRFAPSPTGPLHFGSLVAALASFADARAAAGRWLLRIEDVDTPRSVEGAEAAIVAILRAFGFAWDGDVMRQSARTAAYEQALSRLRAQGLVYECACTRRDLEGAPLVNGERVYPGTCHAGIPPAHAHRTQRSLRVRVPDETIAFVDRLQGPQAQALQRDVGDFVVRRADGLFAYQLAVVVDDAAQGVTSVVRGADLLASTPRQIFLQRALGMPTPSYLHVPVVLDRAGQKLSKQTRADPVGGDACAALLRAWRFLDQPPPPRPPAHPAQFWAHALRAWTPSRLPPVAMLPMPR
ncbi:MAG TPA: tRNA glutamyl-Q(34) synthetase GluQRS [Casimicrobiaceae bacterium]|nr:tRNA glutamyl-Q(34) synthetase GluQRS [Casimicrobiaceae bacterium]